MEWVRLIHVLGAIAGGYYLLLPFVAARMSGYTQTIQVGTLRNLFLFNRFGQYILILQFLSGGYLISKLPYSYMWMVAVIVIFLVVGALAGMMARPMKRMRESLENGKQDEGNLRKIQVYSALIAIGFVILVLLMAFPTYR